MNIRHAFFLFAVALLLVACDQGHEADSSRGASRGSNSDPAAGLLGDAYLGPPEGTEYNLVLICIDTVRRDTFFGTEKFPYTDSLAPWLKSAIDYQNAQSPAPWTIPAVASLMTGLYPQQHQAGLLGRPVANLNTQIPSRLPEEAVTLAETMGDNGFEIIGFVAHPWFSADFGLEQGFPKILRVPGWEKLIGLFDDWWSRIGRKGEPFFAYFHFMDAHSPHKKSARELARRIEQLSPADQARVADLASKRDCADDPRPCLQNQVYNDGVAETRKAVAAILDRLEASGDLDNTVVMVYSDHGEEFWEHVDEARALDVDPRGLFGFGHGQSLFQELIHVPLLVWHPGVPEGASVDQVVSLVDVYPTLVQWLGLDADTSGLPGALLPVSPSSGRSNRTVFSTGIAFGPEQLALREADEKITWHHATDALQRVDLASDAAEKTPQLDGAWILGADVRFGDFMELPRLASSGAPEVTDEQLERLKAIGYLQGIEETQSQPAHNKPALPQDEAEETEDEK